MHTFTLGEQLQQAQTYAQQANFDAFVNSCQEVVAAYSNNADVLLNVGTLLLNFGFLNFAYQCFVSANKILPNDLRPLTNAANLLREAGNHAESRRLYTFLAQQFIEHPVIRRNALVSLEYDPVVTDNERFSQAQAWGQWVIAKHGGVPRRPDFIDATQMRTLRIGYVSADLCQHTVGLFIKDILLSHDGSKVTPVVYSAGVVNDWVTEAIRNACIFRQVSALNDESLAKQIQQDNIDVLVDLSGHTAGSRLTVFSYRPAPVQVSWLGYFATTGLKVMDAVLLDEWHAPIGTEAQFVEPIIRLPHGRFCYTPVPFAPTTVSVLPSSTKGFITFGCFNNTAKFNTEVYAAWAQILTAVPNSRLILKWRTFQDADFCHAVSMEFVQRGIAQERIELRGASFHAEMLKEYADIDIALDPFPFSGGLTSCEALWMGVPVITLPLNRVVSRQTHAFLASLDLLELSAESVVQYVDIAVTLANDLSKLADLREHMRAKMQASKLMDIRGFTMQLEQTFSDLFYRLAQSDNLSDCAVIG